MTPDARASFLDAAVATTGSLLRSTVAAHRDVTDETTGTPREQAARMAAARRTSEDRGHAEVPPAQSGASKPDAESPARTGNPLWALPLKQLSVTRERPLFSPSRRPPPPAAPTTITPVAVRQPIKAPEPERLTASLVGTIIGPDDQIGVFLDTGTQSIVRLRVGEDHRGWVLRLVKAREVTLVKNGEQAMTLELRRADEAAPTLAVPASPPVISALPEAATGTVPIISHEVSADEQPVRSSTARARRR
ncbi:MAG: general secretion pathway protein GspN [Alphaproteobacteria bacterium]|nr:general secretion pathway protein GspN [Alphaproteobacteria bacterium]